MKALGALLTATMAFAATAAPPTYDAMRLIHPEGTRILGWNATDLNNAGMVVGYGYFRGFRWTASKGFKSIRGPLPDFNDPLIQAVDDAGNAAGSTFFVGNRRSAALFQPGRPAFDVGALVPEAYFSLGNAISNTGHVAGHYQGDVGGRSVAAAFVWNASDGMQRIGDDAPGFSPYTWATGVNRHGHVVGWQNTNRSFGFFWSRERGIVDIPHSLQAMAINDRDQVVGVALGVAGGPNVAFVADRASKVTRLPSPAGSNGCTALAINNLGQIVGFCPQAGGSRIPAHAILWWPESGGYEAVDLNAQFGIDDDYDYETCAEQDVFGEGHNVNYRAAAINDLGHILVQMDCRFTYDTADLTIGFNTFVLTPQASR